MHAHISHMACERIQRWICPSVHDHVVTINFSDTLCMRTSSCATYTGHSTVNLKFQNSASVVTSRHVATNVRTIQRWIFSGRKLIFWEASSKITLVFPSPKTNLLSDLPKNYFLETHFSVEFRFSMAVSCSLGNSPNDSNSPLTFSSVLA